MNDFIQGLIGENIVIESMKMGRAPFRGKLEAVTDAGLIITPTASAVTRLFVPWAGIQAVQGRDQPVTKGGRCGVGGRPKKRVAEEGEE